MPNGKSRCENRDLGRSGVALTWQRRPDHDAQSGDQSGG